MDWAHYLSFNLAILAALISPGPAFIVMLRSSVSGGRSAALRTGLGLSTAAVLWTALALGGLTALFSAVPAAYLMTKVAGAGYLLWLAFSIWRRAGTPPGAAPPRGLQGYFLGLAANFSNPKAVLFIAATFATILPAQMAGTDRALLLLNHFILEVTFYTLLALAFDAGPFRRAYLGAKRLLDRMTALMLGALALRLAT